MSAPRTRIGLREIRAMSPNETIFDGGTGSVPGFGARRRAGPHVSYFIMYRTRDGRQRRYTIGTHGAPWTPDAARAKAQQVLVAARIEGADPQADKKAKRSAATIAELCDMYMEDAEAGRLLTRRGIAKKPSTLVTDRSFIQAHIKPLLGRMKVPDAVERREVWVAVGVAMTGNIGGAGPFVKFVRLVRLWDGREIAKRSATEPHPALQGSSLETVCIRSHFLRQFPYEASSPPDQAPL